MNNTCKCHLRGGCDYGVGKEKTVEVGRPVRGCGSKLL